MPPDQPPGPTLFDAELRPHRSLGPSGFLVLMSCVALVSFVTGVVFLIAGAWPVLGFFGLDVALIYLAFRLNYRSGRLTERVRLSPARLEVERTSPSGRVTRWQFQPYWVRVRLEAAGEHHSRVTLSSHGRKLSVGAFLSPDERSSFCAALKDALARCRNGPEPAAAEAQPASPRTSRMP